MTILKGSNINEYNEEIIPEHPILTAIKKDSKDNKFGYESVYDKMHTSEMEPCIDVMRQFGTVSSGAIFNGNHSIPMEAIAQLEGIDYEHEVRRWYLFTSFMPAQLKQETKCILDGINNYQLLSYCDSVDHDTDVRSLSDRIFISNDFTDRFSFNRLGREYLVKCLKNFGDYRSLILSPNETQRSLEECVDYIYGRVSVKPQEPQYSRLMGEYIKSSVDTGLFDCRHIVLVADDILVVSFDKSDDINFEGLKNNFHICYDSIKYLNFAIAPENSFAMKLF